MSGQGFASFSTTKKKELSSRGGKKAHEIGKAHKYDSARAKLASMKGVQAKKIKRAQAAALRLLASGFTAEQLNKLELTVDEWIKYGGKSATDEAFEELKGRVADVEMQETS